MLSKISIITPSFNQGQYLEQTIDSVLSQGYSSLQYIVIDGGSSDNSVDIIRKYEKHISYWVSEPDRGQSHAINKGLKITTGEIVNWLNSDDYLEPGSLKLISENFSDPSVNVLIGRCNIIEDQKIISVTNGTDVYSGNLAKTIGMARIDQPETYFRKSVYDKIGFLDESLHYVMDKEFWIRFLIFSKLKGVVKIPDIIANFRLHDNSKTQSQAVKFEQESIELIYQLAVTNHSYEKANTLKTCFDYNFEKLNGFREAFVTAPDIAGKALDYFILYKADSSYYNNNHDLSLKLLSAIDINNLDASDQLLYKQLVLKSKYLPVWLKKFSRLWK